MKLKINGDNKDFNETSPSVSDIIRLENVESPDMVSVQLNGEFLERASYPLTVLKENDEIDFLYFMGGGAR